MARCLAPDRSGQYAPSRDQLRSPPVVMSDDLDRVKKAAEALGEHFETVQIFVTKHEPEIEDGTVNIAWSTGNFFARYGQVREWLIKVEERTRKFVREED